ncbi:MFS transporter [Kibdelosporangium aridum]|uniref:Predicted arabinose efflux permease, MFS family n=1 Tax=Kibdelosporangium aridum TaxID=2030 RepID=A0A1Y5XLL9_KIBAR|nr:MFS transporter [Kibdelosporangium aridum]SMD05152.1 Predicted arabinose efflux permease, MFS family [Kibdelosporangium aridum]
MTHTITAPVRGQTRLPAMALFGLFLSGFIGILTECLPAGLLPEISNTLGTSIAATGQIVTIYALATAVAAIPLSRLTSMWPRKNVLQVALGIVAVTNALTAVSTNYTLTMVLRFLAGVGTAMIWPHLGGYAARLAPAGRQGRAIAIALAGTPIALALGVPVGTWIGSFGGWEIAFYASTALVLLNMLWVQVTLPNLPGHSVDEHKLSRVLLIPGLRTILFALTAYMVAHNIVYTYITDFLRHVGMSSQTGWVLFAFGVTSVLSVLVVGAHIDHHLRKLIVASTVVFAISVLVLAVLSGIPALVYVAVAAWGLAFGSSPSLFIGGAIKATGEAAHVAQSIVITFFSASIALGGFIGGLLVDVDTALITWASLALLIAAAVAVIGGKKHAFPPSA